MAPFEEARIADREGHSMTVRDSGPTKRNPMFAERLATCQRAIRYGHALLKMPPIGIMSAWNTREQKSRTRQMTSGSAVTVRL